MIQRAVVGFLTLLLMFSATFGDGHSYAFGHTDAAIVPSQTADGTDQENQESEREEYKLMAYEAVLPLLHANLSPIQCSFTQVTLVVVHVVEEVGTFHIPYISYFNTLFRLIISPNAP